jgi:TolB protein
MRLTWRTWHAVRRLALVLACVAWIAPAAEATFPGRNGRIAFTADEPANEGEDASYAFVVSIRPDGSDPRVLAGQGAEDPAYRPDGHMIAFSRFRNVRMPSAEFDWEYVIRERGVFLMRANGTHERRLIAGPYVDPDWSPTGQQLVVTRTRRPRGLVIWRRGQLRRLTAGSNPAWSPTGRQIAFVRNDIPHLGDWTTPRIYLARADGTGIHRIAPGHSPEWSPDGRRIIFSGAGRTYVIRPDRTGLHRVAPVPQRSPIYSPNGSFITYTKGLVAPFQYGWNDFILMMRANGRDRTRIFPVSNSDAIPQPGSFTMVGDELDWQPRPR